MNKKGFTFIELLAVIVILGIVTVIATQAILPYMKNAKRDAFATEASSIILSAKNAVDMYNLNKLEIGNDNNSCIKDNIMCFTVEELIDSGLYNGDKNKYSGKVQLNLENENNIISALYFQKGTEYNIVSSYATDFSKNKEDINTGTFSGGESEYTTCSCDEFGSGESTPTFTFYLGGSNNPEYANTEIISTYLSWNYNNISSYCLSSENDSEKCDWKNVNGTSVSPNYTLTGEDEIKVVYAFLKDSSGNIKSASDTIILDKEVPVVTAESLYNNTENARIIITSSKDGTYCINKSSVSNDMNNCVVFSGISNKVLSNSSMLSGVLSEDGEYYVHVKDSAGNIGISNKVDISLSSKNIGDNILSNPTTGLNTRLEGGLYRYQGTSVDNYICFGTSDKDTCLGNKDAYMYRIIGIAEDGKIKVMKNYAFNTTYYWHNSNSSNTIWPNSDLYKGLNGISGGKYSNLFIGNTSYMPSGWEDKIETTTWKYGDNTNFSVTADALYNTENAWTDTVDAKIGLIYAHDYYYAYQSGGLNCSSTGSYSTCKTSWMHIYVSDSSAPSTYEWTVSRYGYNGVYRYYTAFNVGTNGDVNGNNIATALSIRPVFFLKYNIQLIGGTGTSTDPFIIS